MKSKTILTMAALIIALLGSPSLAHDAEYGGTPGLPPSYTPTPHYYPSPYPGYPPAPECIEDRWIRLDLTPGVELTNCEEGEKLALAMTRKSYPLLRDNPYDVKYWKGSYRRKKIESWTYLHEVTDRCARKTLLSERKILKETSTLEFKVDNPNLHDDVYATYQLVPLTDEEAQAALEQALMECQRYGMTRSDFSVPLQR